MSDGRTVGFLAWVGILLIVVFSSFDITHISVQSMIFLLIAQLWIITDLVVNTIKDKK